MKQLVREDPTTGKKTYRYTEGVNDPAYLEDKQAYERIKTQAQPRVSASATGALPSVAQATGTVAPTGETLFRSKSGIETYKPETWKKMNLGQFGKNIAGEAGGIAKGIAAMPAMAMQPLTTAVGFLTDPQKAWEQEQMKAKQFLPMVGQVAGGIASDYARLVTNPIGQVYDKPITAAADIASIAIPVTKAIKASKAAKAAEVTGGAMKVTKPATEVADELTKITKEARKMFPTYKPPAELDAATKSYMSAFTIPTKRAKSIKIADAAKEMVKYEIGGSVPTVKNKVDRVVDVVSHVNRNAIGDIATPIDMSDSLDAVKNLERVMTEVSPEDAVKVQNMIKKLSLEPKLIKGDLRLYTQPNGAIDAFDIAKKLERKGAESFAKSTYLTPNARMEELGKMYYSAADAIMDNIGMADKTGALVAKYKTPEVLQAIAEVSPKAAEAYAKGAKTIDASRSFIKNFVRISQAADLTMDALNSAAVKLGSSLAGKFFGAAGGGILGGWGGAIGGMMASEALAPTIGKAVGGASSAMKINNAIRLAKAAPQIERAAIISKAIGTGMKASAKAKLVQTIIKKLGEAEKMGLVSAPTTVRPAYSNWGMTMVQE